ncbi:MAG: hypothetical protein JSV65_04840 [Armatimonadota bacterium]|nr:MAG: hypothetical protein JSV65_04840 [Armatimonadota bacterium]
MNQESQQGGEGRRSVQFPQWLVTVIVVLAVAAAGVLVGIFVSSRALGVKWPPPKPTPQATWEEQVGQSMKADPKLGATIELPEVEDLDKRKVQLPLPGVSALMYVESYNVGDEDIRVMERELAAYPQVKTCVVFMLSDPEMVRQKAQENGFRSLFLYDRAGQMRDALNAFDNARVYIFDRAGRLVFIENPADDDEDIIAKAKAAVEKALSGD